MQEKTIKKVSMKTKSKDSKQNTKGITLIALVITIVVLLILAGVSIVVLLEDNGIIKQAQNSNLQTKFLEVEEKANVIYADLDTKRYAGKNTNKKITMGEITKELQNQKYTIKEVEVGENVIEAIELKQTTIKMGKSDEASIEVTLKKNDEGMAYYVKVEDKYYKISLENGHITLDKTNGKLENEIEENKNTETTTQKLKATSNKEDVVTVKEPINNNIIEIESKETVGTAEITVTYGDLKPQKCKVTVAIQPIEGSTDINNTIKTNYGRIDVIWIDENNKVIAEPNKPILESEENGTVEAKTKMRAVKWVEEDGTMKEAPADETNPDEEWYDYREKDIEEGVEGSNLADNTQSHWANAKTENGSYFVWIPRYAYRITYYADETSLEPTGYYDGNGMWSAVDGKKKYDLEEGIETVKHNEQLYIVHPAFGTTKTDEVSKAQNIDLGGWDKPLTGFWFAKFEMSGEDGASLKSVPSVKSQRIKTIGVSYTISRTANYGQIGIKDSEENGGDGNESFMYSHMCKNSEWGAVAYLTHSQYGRNGHEISINASDTYTGGGTNKNSYINEDNQKQSTTGNVYGIYDMSGGITELMAVFNSVEGNTVDGNSFASTGGSSSKYATAYDGKKEANSPLWLFGKTGDATKEITFEIDLNVSDYGKRWFKDYSNGFSRGNAFITRGWSYSNGEGIGIFAAIGNSGWPGSYQAFRTVLCP